MSRTRFASVRSLFSGTALSSPREDDEPAAPAADATKPAAGPTPEQVDAAMATEVATATASANTRWNTVMTSDAGLANPKAAASLLMAGGGVMSADDVVATLGGLGAPAPAAGKDADAPSQARELNEARRELQAGEADPKTGASAGSPEQRRGEGDGDSRTALKESRAKRAAARNKGALAKGGKTPDRNNG